MDLGERVPDLSFVVAGGRDRRLSELCPGAAVMVFLRYLG